MQEVKVELFIPGELKDEPIICEMIKNFKIDMKIMEASFSTESGWAYLIINAESDEIERPYDHLRSKGVNIEVRS
jgi:ABC-type methionine transport system ATPase subunit